MLLLLLSLGYSAFWFITALMDTITVKVLPILDCLPKLYLRKSCLWLASLLLMVKLPMQILFKNDSIIFTYFYIGQFIGFNLRLSLRIFLGIWFLMMVVLINAYTGTLTSQMTASKLKQIPQSLEELTFMRNEY